MRLRLSEDAREDLFNLADYIALDSPANAQIVGERILQAAELLLETPRIGRVGRIDGTREWPVRRTSHLLIYRIDGEDIFIVRVLHGRQDWPPG